MPSLKPQTPPQAPPQRPPQKPPQAPPQRPPQAPPQRPPQPPVKKQSPPSQPKAPVQKPPQEPPKKVEQKRKQEEVVDIDVTEDRKLVSLVSQLKEKGYKLYGTETCGWTVKQKTILQKQFDQIKYINCEKEREKCGNIMGFPTWEDSQNKMYPGFKDLEGIEKMLNGELTPVDPEEVAKQRGRTKTTRRYKGIFN